MEDLRKTMTKKAYKNLQRKNRSVVGLGKSLGSITMKSNKDYSRAEGKKICRMAAMI